MRQWLDEDGSGSVEIEELQVEPAQRAAAPALNRCLRSFGMVFLSVRNLYKMLKCDAKSRGAAK